MKIIKSDINRYSDIYYINLDISIGISKSYEKCDIFFKNNDCILYVISSTDGNIFNNTITINYDCKYISVSIEHISNMEYIECFVSYYNYGDLIESESTSIIIKKSENISPSNIQYTNINGVDTNVFNDKLHTFFNILNKKRGNCSIHVDIKDDIIITVLVSPQQNTYLSFGEITSNIMSSDVIFLLYTGVKKIILPKEIIWKSYDKYSHRARLGCCEIIKPTFCSVKNIYYKIPVSNLILVSDTPRITKCELEHFSDPLNRNLDTEKWYIGSANLPIYRE